MKYRLLLDENVEHEAGTRLGNYGHDVEHVDFTPSLGKGTSDERIAAHCRETDRALVTYDDDFVLAFDVDGFAVLYVADRSLATEHVADAVHEMSRHYPQTELTGVMYVGREWLE